MVGIKKKLDRREATRERKALAAAHLEKSIEKELLERLRSKAYGDAPLNVNEDVWQMVLEADKGKGKELEELMDDESEEEFDELEDEDDEEVGQREFVEDDESGSEVGDMEDWSADGVSRLSSGSVQADRSVRRVRLGSRGDRCRRRLGRRVPIRPRGYRRRGRGRTKGQEQEQGSCACTCPGCWCQAESTEERPEEGCQAS